MCTNTARLHLLHEACRTLTRVHLPKSRVNPKIYDHTISDADNQILFCVPPKAGCSAFKILSPSCATFYLDRGGGGGLAYGDNGMSYVGGLGSMAPYDGPLGTLGHGGRELGVRGNPAEQATSEPPDENDNAHGDFGRRLGRSNLATLWMAQLAGPVVSLGCEKIYEAIRCPQ